MRGNDGNAEMKKTDEGERIAPETDPAWKPVKNEKTVEDRRGEEGLISETDPERQMITKDVHTQETLDTDQEHFKERPEVSPTVSQEETQMEKHSSDTEDMLETRDNRLNLVPGSKTNLESVMVETFQTDDTNKWGKNIRSPNTGMQEEAERDETDVKLKKSDQEEEERESKLVAGLNLHETNGGTHGEEREIVEQKRAEKVEDIKNANHKELAERGKEDQVVVNNLTPHLSTSSAPERKELEIPATIQIITQTQNPPLHDHNVPPPLPLTPTHVPPVSSHPPSPYTKVSFRLSSPSVNLPTPIGHMSDSTMSPGHHEMVKNMLLKPGEINTVDQPEEGGFIAMVLAGKPNPKEANITVTDLMTKEQSNQNISTAKLGERDPHTAQSAGKPRAVKRAENGTKVAAKQNKSSPPQTEVTKPQVATAKTPSARPTKTNKSSRNRTMKKSREKKRKKDNKTQKPPEKKKKTAPTTYFPYFMDNYCPPECACYGR